MKCLYMIFTLLALITFSSIKVQAQWLQTNGPSGGDILTIAVSGSDVFAGTNGGGVFLSTNNGSSWTNAGLAGRIVYSIVFSGNNLVAATDNSVLFLSSDLGKNWNYINNGIISGVSALAASGSNIFAGTNQGVFLTTDNGQTWRNTGPPVTNPGVITILINGNNIFAGTNGNGVFLSTDNGTSWANIGLTNHNITSFAISGNYLFAGAMGDGVFLSTDLGENWNAVNTGIAGYGSLNITSLAISSNDNGGTDLFAGTWDYGVFHSTDLGTSWVTADSGLITPQVNGFAVVHTLAFSGANLFAGTWGGVFISTNYGANWNLINKGLFATQDYAFAFYAAGTGANNLFSGTMGNGVSLSTDEGNNWVTLNSDLTRTAFAYGCQVWCLTIAPPTDDKNITKILAGTNTFLYQTTNNGENWSNTGSTIAYTHSAGAFPNGKGSNNIYAGSTYSGGMSFSTDNGATWNTYAFPNYGINSFTAYSSGTNGMNVFAGTYGGGIFLSTDNCNTWVAVNNGLTNSTIWSLASFKNVEGGNNILAATGGGVFMSSDNGSNWNNIGLANENVKALNVLTDAAGGINIFAGSGNGVFLSTNYGSNWKAVSSGLINMNIYSLTTDGVNLFAGTFGNAVWRRPLSEIIPGPATESWRIGITASVGAISDSNSYAAVDSAATFGFDGRFDFPKPPLPPNNYVYVCFSHPEWNSLLGQNFLTDVRQDTDLSSAAQIWTFKIFSDQYNKLMSLCIKPKLHFPANYQIFLRDMITDSLQDIGKNDTYNYNTGTDSSRTFQIMVGKFMVKSYNYSAGWSMAGFPIMVDKLPVSSLLSSNSGMYLYSYSSNGGYITTDTVSRGKGYWLGLISPAAFSALGTTAWDLESVPLNKGFNMISLPYYISNYPKQNLFISKGASLVSLDSAVSLSWVSPVLYYYQSSLGSYTETDTLFPWNGYWFAAIDSSLQLVFEPPLSNLNLSIPALRFSSMQKKPDVVQSNSNWSVRISLRSGNLIDQLGVFGVSENVKEGFDAEYDLPHPPSPPVPGSVCLAFPHPEWKCVIGPDFSSDFRPSGQSSTWKFIASSSVKPGMAELLWDTAGVPESAALMLNDLNNNRIIDMRKTGKYQFLLNSADTMLITSSVSGVNSKSRIIPSKYELYQNYPNPFNPSTIICYDVPVSGHITLKIYDVLGKELVTLYNGNQLAGTYYISFDASKLASGIYFYQLIAGDVVFTKKMMLLK